MMKAGSIFWGVLLLLALPSMCVFAYDVTESSGDYHWSAADWQKLNNEPYRTFEQEINWSRGVGEANAWCMWGDMPTDPAVSQKVRNYTNGEWSDWHVVVHNGTIDQNTARVYRYLPAGVNWNLSFASGIDGNGQWTSMTAIAPGPGDTVIKPNVLSIYFFFTPINGSLPITIDEWPTTDYVPEPSSMAAMAMGLIAVGFSLRRRIR